MARSLLIFFLSCSIAIGVYGQSITRGPYLQKSNTDRITIKWRTDKSTHSKIEYGTSLFNLNLAATETSLKTEHEIELLSLSPNTTYYYRIGDLTTTLLPASTDLYFKTNPAVASQDATRFWVLGDCGTANNNQRAVRDAYYNYVGTQHTDGILMLGDNAYNSGTDDEYQRAVFENMYEDKLKNTVTWSCLGNHDGYTANSNEQTGPYYDIFSFPTAAESGGTPSGTEAYYSFDYADIHFISLDSYETDRSKGGSMYNWLENDLQNNGHKWLVAFWHHPAYSKGSHNSDTESQMVEMRQNFLPLLEDYGVDVVFSGHSHSYERSYFLNQHYGSSNTFDPAIHTVGANGHGDGQEDGNGAYEKLDNGEDGRKGMVYITAGSSGKKSGGSLNHPAMFYSVSQLGSCVIEVEGDQMDVKFIRENGSIEDYFTINKSRIACTPGTSCDDGNPNTTNDIYDTDCICVGNDGVQTETICLSPASSSDDAEEEVSSGTMDLNSSDLEMIQESSNQIVGIRFPQSFLTDTTEITNAYLQFTVDESNNDNTSLEIKGETATYPATYNSTNYNISSRATTNATVSWKPSVWNTINEAGSAQRTPDLTTIIDEIMQQPSFADDAAIALQIEGSGKRVAHSFDGNPGNAPMLCLEYEKIPCLNIAQSCNDGDPCTINDQYDNDCNCIGVYLDSDQDGVCNINDVCNGAEPGTPCSDGNPCTVGDAIDNNCNCVGTFVDTDNDNICDGLDLCPSLDDNLIGTACSDNDPCTTNDIYTTNCECVGVYRDSDNDGVCDALDQCFGPEPGTTCNDNNACTTNDVYDANCNCVGTFQDSDNDGVCDALDNCPTFNDNLIGTACNDNNTCTINDVYNTNCQCVGTYQDSDNDGVCDALDQCFGSEPGTTCNDNDPCTTNDRINANCQCVGTYQDSDSDGICDENDSCPFFNNNLIGTACNDNNTCTINDVYNANCQCVGTYQDSDNDGVCDALDQCFGSDPGTTCNDNDPCTTNDRINANCQCVGTLIDNDNDGICDSSDPCPSLDNTLIGTVCDDGDPCTVGETYDSNCNCTGGINTCLQKVYARIFLEGFLPTDSTRMNTLLNDNGLLPNTQPYNQAPWNYLGNETKLSSSPDIVDWILVMVRDADGNIIDQKAGFVNKYGVLIDNNGNNGITLLNPIGNFISIHHRSHIDVLSSSLYTGSFYDFTTSVFKANGTEQLKLKNGIYCLIGGDYDGNAIINSVDFNNWKAQSAVLNQYLSIDVDGNGIVNSLDYNIWTLNRSKLGHPFLRY